MKYHIAAFREYLLNRILKVDPDGVLNYPDLSSREVPGGSSLDREIKKSINQLRAEVVSENGQSVDYAKMVKSPTYQEYRMLVNGLESFDFLSLPSRESRLAFWINLYNALAIDAVIQEKIKSSVTESWLGILGFFQKAAYRIGGERFSLTDIEHGVLRGNAGFPYFPGPHFSNTDPRKKAVIEPMDSRIHFALNCASKSCPPIGVYDPAQIDQQLDLAAQNFINAESKLNLKNRRNSISQIFRWYWKDFGGKSGILDLLHKYLDPPDGAEGTRLNLSDFRLSFHSYDWGLNKLD